MTDELSFFRGCMWGLGISLPIWLVIFLTVHYITI